MKQFAVHKWCLWGFFLFENGSQIMQNSQMTLMLTPAISSFGVTDGITGLRERFWSEDKIALEKSALGLHYWYAFYNCVSISIVNVFSVRQPHLKRTSFFSTWIFLHRQAYLSV